MTRLGNWLQPPFLSEFASIWHRGGRLHCQRMCVQVPVVASMEVTSRMPGSRALEILSTFVGLRISRAKRILSLGRLRLEGVASGYWTLLAK